MFTSSREALERAQTQTVVILSHQIFSAHTDWTQKGHKKKVVWLNIHKCLINPSTRQIDYDERYWGFIIHAIRWMISLEIWGRIRCLAPYRTEKRKWNPSFQSTRSSSNPQKEKSPFITFFSMYFWWYFPLQLGAARGFSSFRGFFFCQNKYEKRRSLATSPRNPCLVEQ